MGFLTRRRGLLRSPSRSRQQARVLKKQVWVSEVFPRHPKSMPSRSGICTTRQLNASRIATTLTDPCAARGGATSSRDAMLNYWRAVLLLIVFGDMGRLARVVVLGLRHQITRRGTAGRRPSSTTIIAARADSISEVRGLKVPRHFTSISRPGRVPSVWWDGIAQETVTIFDGGPQNARRRRERLDVKSAESLDILRTIIF